MNSVDSDTPNDNQQSPRWTARASGLVIQSTSATDRYANAVLSLAVAKQRLKSIAGQRSKVSKRYCRFPTFQLQPCGTLNAEERLNVLARSKVPVHLSR
jgi:hypothetical protein